MSGLAYQVVRSVRGIPATMERVASGRLWGGQNIPLWERIANDGISDTGAPTGIEHAFIGFGVIVVRSWWTSRGGALAFRELVRREDVAIELTSLFASSRRAAGRDTADVVDIDRIFALCGVLADPKGLVPQLRKTRLFRRRGLDAALFERLTSFGRPPPAPPEPTGIEKDLRAAVVASPADEGAAIVYGDWLEQHGRVAEATALRPELAQRPAVLPPSAVVGPQYSHPLPQPVVPETYTGPRLPDPDDCDACHGPFKGWRYRCGRHVTCSDCAITNRHTCPHCQHVLVGSP